MSNLKLNISTSPKERHDLPVLTVSPILNVSDITDTINWFAKLGWTRGFEWQDNPADPHSPANFASVICDDHEIFLCRNGQGGRGRGSNAATFGPDGDETADKGVWMSIFVDDLEHVHDRCVKSGLEITYPPTREPWGVREMHVRHPDGHVFRISTRSF
jgi:catechol 2,3-dioxygenase-like lactoylglutathione lyase family enzyme